MRYQNIILNLIAEITIAHYIVIPFINHTF